MKEEEGLDRIFKQGLSEPGHIADYRESDWDAFEQMLDEKEKKRPVILWLRIASGIAAVLLLAFGWFYMQGSHTQITKQPLAVQPVKKGGDNTSPAVQRVSSSGQQVAVAAPVKDHTGTSGGLDHQNAGGVIKTPSSVKRNHILAVDRPYRKDKSFFTLSPPAARRDTAGLVSNDNSIYARNSIETLAAVNEQQIDAQNAKGMISFPSVEKKR